MLRLNYLFDPGVALYFRNHAPSASSETGVAFYQGLTSEGERSTGGAIPEGGGILNTED